MSGTVSVDQATVAFRRLLGEAGASERARVDALFVLSQRTVFAGTWPGQQAVRTLTNRQGETAMPLFSGRDALEDTATRFGWRGPDGVLHLRELSAREALQHALARGVHFVVLDIGTEHAVEFSREEIEPLLSVQKARGGDAFAATGEPEAVIRQAVRRSSRPPRPSDDMLMPAPAPARVLGSAVEIDMPFAELKARGGRAVSQPITPHAARASAAQSSATRPAPQPVPARANPQVAASATSTARMPAQRAPSQSTLGVARPPAPLQPSATGASAASHRAVMAATSVTAPSTRPAAPAAARAQVRVAEHDEAARPDASETVARPAHADDTERTAAEPAHEAASSERESGEQAKASLAALVPDTLLQAISNGLRAFPEVEWACVLPETSGVPTIGVRVDPSFLNRVAEVTDAIMSAASACSQDLSVMLLNSPESVKSARKSGQAFYPWKR